jgi:hypothetical protein
MWPCSYQYQRYSSKGIGYKLITLYLYYKAVVFVSFPPLIFTYMLPSASNNALRNAETQSLLYSIVGFNSSSGLSKNLKSKTLHPITIHRFLFLSKKVYMAFFFLISFVRHSANFSANSLSLTSNRRKY